MVYSPNPSVLWTVQSRAGSQAWTLLAASVSPLLVDGQVWKQIIRTSIGEQCKACGLKGMACLVLRE